MNFVDVRSWKWNWKLTEGKNPSDEIQHLLGKGLIVAQVSFVQVSLFCEGKFNRLYTQTCFAKYDFFVDYLVVRNRAHYTISCHKTTRHCISSSYTRIYLRDAFSFLISIYHFLVDPFVVTNHQGHSCELSRLLGNLQLRYAFTYTSCIQTITYLRMAEASWFFPGV